MSNKMEKSLTSKAFSRNISYKRQGIRTDPLANRFLRANRIQEERKKTRVNEISKRRRMPLSPLQDCNATMSESLMKVKAENSKKMVQPYNSRKELLMKWREEKKLKQKMDALTNIKKNTFIVGQVKYRPPAMLSEKSVPDQTKKENRATKEVPAKRVTRASARLAQKQETARPRSPVRKPPKKSKKVQKQDEQKETMQNTNKDTKSSGSLSNGVRTRSQLLKNKEINNMKLEAEKETVIKHDYTDKNNKKATKMEAAAVFVAENSPQRSFPDFEATKNTISFGRGGTEGVSRTAQEVFKSDNEPTTSEPESFAPINFKFTVPSGVNSFLYSASNFHFKPLSPKSADAFLFPTSASFFESPHAPALSPLKRDKKTVTETGVTLGNTIAIPENPHDIGGVVNSEECSVSSSTDYQHKENSLVDDNVDQLKGSECDSSYFRNLLKMETLKLNNLSNKWDEISESETDLSDEVLGQIRTVIGQAQLLIDQRFKQFSGLIDLSENTSAEKKATSSDLQGFWDMIYFQVEDVITKFDKLDKLRENKWLEETKQIKNEGKKTKIKKKAVQTNQPPKSKAGKNRLQEMRAAMKAKMAEQKAKMASQCTSEDNEDVAFFTVLTPIKRKTCSDDGMKEVVLTPVRRSARKAFAQQSVSVVSTPRLHDDPIGSLRLTPESTTQDQPIETNRNDEEIVTVEAIIEPASSVLPSASKVSEDVSAAAECSDGKMATKRRSRVSFAKDTAIKHMKISPESKSFQTPISLSSSDNDDVNVDDSPVTGHSEVKKSLKSSKRSVNRKRSSTRCRVPTPYYSNRSASRIKDKNKIMETDSPIANVDKVSTAECSMDVAVTTPKNGSFKELAAFSLNTSLAQTPPTLHRESSPCERDDIFSCKYLCATSSGDENTQKQEAANDVFESNSCPDEMSDDSLELQDTDFQDPGLRPPILSPEPKLWRTPKNLISCLSDLDTPSPSSCLTTPVPPKTTFFISPLEGGHNVTPYTPESPAFAGMEKAESNPVLVEVTPEVTRKMEHQSNIECEMESFNNQSPVETFNSRRDSVFSSAAPINGDCVASDDEAPQNLIFFSPAVTHDASNNKENQPRGSVKRFAAITPSKKMRGLLGTDCVLSPVRRSARLNMDDCTSVSSLQVSSVSDLPPDLDFGYQPNPLLTNK